MATFDSSTTSYTHTTTKDGFIAMRLRNLSLNTSMFHRITIDGFQISQGWEFQKVQNYTSVMPFPTKAGSTINFQFEGHSEAIIYYLKQIK